MMSHVRPSFWMGFFAALLILNVSSTARAQTGENAGNVSSYYKVIPGSETHHDTSGPLRNIVPIPGSVNASQLELHPPQSPAMRAALPARSSGSSETRPPHVTPNSGVSTIPVMNEAGLGLFFSGPQGSFTPMTNPSNATGAVGTTQYLQWVDDSFAVFDKTSGNVLYGPAAGNTLWSGFGGACQNDNDGQPTVNFDKLANRWVVSQHAVSSGVPYLQCVAVSTTSDATGTWNRYAFVLGNLGGLPAWQNLNAKLGVWPDAYYMAFDMYSGTTFEGEEFCAFQRASMITGSTAGKQCAVISSYFYGAVVSDLDGLTAPPAGAPAYFAAEDSGLFAIDFWKFHVDWTDYQNTTLSAPIVMGTGNPNPSCSPSSFVGLCVPQPGTSQLLDSVGGRLIGRMPYRNYGTQQSLFMTETDGSAPSPSGGPAAATAIGFFIFGINGNGDLYGSQFGLFAPDQTNFRFLPSIASDRAGNVAVAYNLSSSTTYPSQYFASRAPTDPAGTMGNETLLNPGNASQTVTSAWDSRASLTVDPVDDCTYWYTQQYIPYAGATEYVTLIAGQYLAGCPVSTITLNTVPTGLSVTANGKQATAPFSGQYSVGSTLSIGTSSPQTLAGVPGTQYVFSSWSDGGAQTHNVTVPSTNTTYTANFTSQYQLTTAVSPSGGGTVTPASGGYYAANSVVSLKATAAAGYGFAGWTGAVAAPASASTTITMTQPQTVTANFAPVVLTPATYAFPSQAVGTSGTAKVFTLDNYQSASLTSIVIATTGDFKVSSTTCTSTLAGKGKCTISVVFAPTATGTRTGQLTITDNAGNSPQTAALSGTGLVPATLTPTSVTYAAQTKGTTSAAKVFTLTNAESVSLTSIVVSTTGDFQVSTTTCTTSLAAKGKCTISVTFTPTATGTRTGQLKVTDSAANSPQISTLTGTGK